MHKGMLTCKPAHLRLLPGHASDVVRLRRVYREFEELPHTRQDTGAYYEDRRWMWALDTPIPSYKPSRLLAGTLIADGPRCQGLRCALRNLALPL